VSRPATRPAPAAGYLFAVLGALFFGANGSLTKLVVHAGLSPTQITQFRTLGTAVLAGAVLLVLDRSGFRIRPRQLVVMAVLGIAGVAALQVFYASALDRLPVGITLLIEYLAVLFVALIAFLFFHERVRARLWIAIALVLAGMAVVARIWDSRLDGLGLLLALGAAGALTVYFVIGERQVSTTSPLAVSFWTMLFAAAFWFPLSGWWEISAETLTSAVAVGGVHGELEVPMWAAVAAIVVTGTFLPFLFSFLALRRLTATAVGIAASSEVLFAFAVAWIWLGESLDLAQTLGAAIVLVGIVLAQTSRAGKVVDADLALAPRSDVSGRR
jgi:drug/metabolite transporter (DMT)-like permease